MTLQRLRRRLATHCLWGCLFGVLLMALQPFIATHFRQDGWEDEPGFRIRSVSAQVQFEPDERADHASARETTLFVPVAASIDLPRALQQGIDGLLALVLVLMPLAILMRARRSAATEDGARPEPVANTGGAPPPTALWFSQPPKTAPPPFPN